jgi:ornithine cyclodeaminase/alanine dehydrogenase-like protein (mu-crystallin family)
VLVGKIKGRNSAEDITIYKSLGIAVEDLASANFLYHRACEKDAGEALEIGGARKHGTT